MKQFCKRGHDIFVCGRHKDRHCKECTKLDSQRKYFSNREKFLKMSQLRDKNNPSATREKRWKNRKVKNSDGSKFTVSDYDRLYKIQQGKCAICGRHQYEFKRKLSIDHNHKTGIIRGLLCSVCNGIVLPVLESYSSLIPKAQEYLNKVE